MPMESAAILLSRTAMTARPVRLFTKFRTKNSVTRDESTTPEVKVEIFGDAGYADRAVDDHLAAVA